MKPGLVPFPDKFEDFAGTIKRKGNDLAKYAGFAVVVLKIRVHFAAKPAYLASNDHNNYCSYRKI